MINVSQIVVVSVVNLVPVGAGGGVIYISVCVKTPHNGIVGSRAFADVNIIVNRIDDIAFMVVATWTAAT